MGWRSHGDPFDILSETMEIRVECSCLERQVPWHGQVSSPALFLDIMGLVAKENTAHAQESSVDCCPLKFSRVGSMVISRW